MAGRGIERPLDLKWDGPDSGEQRTEGSVAATSLLHLGLIAFPAGPPSLTATYTRYIRIHLYLSDSHDVYTVLPDVFTGKR